MMADTPAEAEQMAESTEATEANGSAEAAVEAAVTAAPVVLDDHFSIDPAAPLESLDQPHAKAYLAEDRRDPGRKLFALICEPGLPLRMKTLDILKGAAVRGMLALSAAGPVDWPPLKRRCMALVYERPLGGPVIDESTKSLPRTNEYEFPNFVIRPLLRAITELDSRGLTHRAIRPDNLYYLDEDCEHIVLGDCVSAPSGYNQPLLFETIPQSMADPEGRGEGATADDIYALGCTIVFLVVDTHPCDRMTEEQILASKVEKGSFSTLCSNTRVPVPLLEALRGMLNDDTMQRWTLREAESWLNGQRQANPQRKPIIKGDLPFEFMDFEHISPRTIAHAFSKNVEEAIKVINSGELTTWVRRLLHNPNMSEAIANTVEAAKIAHDVMATNEFVVAKVCILLDPAGPIRYKGASFMPDSIGSKLAVDLYRDKSAQRIMEVVTSGLGAVWVGSQPGPASASRLKSIDRLFTQLRGYLNIGEYGFGVERCLYELNEGYACQSPLLSAEYVMDLDALLPALDRAAGRVDAKRRPVDRHIAAFIATLSDQNIDSHLKATSSPRESTRLIGMLSLLALLQWRFKLPPMYGLASWVGGLLEPAVNTYYARTTRREIEREIPRLVRKGSLPDLFDLIDNIDKRETDLAEFEAAKKEFTEAEHEIQEIENNTASRRRQYENKGQQFAAMSSMVLTVVVVLVLMVMESV